MPVSNTHTENPMPLSIETSRIKSARMRLNYGVMKFLAMSLGRSNYILKYLPMKLNMLRWQAHWVTTKSTYVKGALCPFWIIQSRAIRTLINWLHP